jgi:hypothetical protein
MSRLGGQYLMPIGVHASDNIRPSSLLNIDLAFAQIVSRDEEGGLSTICREYVKEMRRVVVWTVVEGQGYCARVLTVVESSGIVRDVTDEWSRHIERRLAQGFH